VRKVILDHHGRFLLNVADSGINGMSEEAYGRIEGEEKEMCEVGQKGRQTKMGNERNLGMHI
jgi:hypothetical protein